MASITVMATRLGARLRFELHAGPGCAAHPVPPMMLLTLVENAVRHGIDPSEAGGRIEVGARRDVATGRVHLWVTDTGRGLDESQPPGTGLANLRGRLAATYGERATLSLSGIEPHGVRAEIELPEQ